VAGALYDGDYLNHAGDFFTSGLYKDVALLQANRFGDAAFDQFGDTDFCFIFFKVDAQFWFGLCCS